MMMAVNRKNRVSLEYRMLFLNMCSFGCIKQLALSGLLRDLNIIAMNHKLTLLYINSLSSAN